MQTKTARFEFNQLLQDAVDEQQENIKIAQQNARCGADDVKPYKTAAQKALIRGARQLVDLVDPPPAN